MEELQLILDNPEKQQEIQEASEYNRSLKVYEYFGNGFQVSGKTREVLLKNLLRTIKMILRG